MRQLTDELSLHNTPKLQCKTAWGRMFCQGVAARKNYCNFETCNVLNLFFSSIKWITLSIISTSSYATTTHVLQFRKLNLSCKDTDVSLPRSKYHIQTLAHFALQEHVMQAHILWNRGTHTPFHLANLSVWSCPKEVFHSYPHNPPWTVFRSLQWKSTWFVPEHG